MPVDTDVDSLAEPFKAKALQLLDVIEREGLPFEVAETRRAFSRTAALFMQGRAYVNGVLKVVAPAKVVSNARAGRSPHNWGLGMDCRLVLAHSWWDGDIPAKNAYDTGYDGQILARPAVAQAWTRYARAVRGCGLVWGGDWVAPVDRPHCELRAWRAVIPKNWEEIALREVQAGR